VGLALPLSMSAWFLGLGRRKTRRLLSQAGHPRRYRGALAVQRGSGSHRLRRPFSGGAAAKAFKMPPTKRIRRSRPGGEWTTCTFFLVTESRIRPRTFCPRRGGGWPADTFVRVPHGQRRPLWESMSIAVQLPIRAGRPQHSRTAWTATPADWMRLRLISHRADGRPKRYPGGKRKLAVLVGQIFARAQLKPQLVVEPFAGGAPVSIALLEAGFVSKRMFKYRKSDAASPFLYTRRPPRI
jgi:hypothetical protein